jgi:uncharacterized protein YgfB (UPF0149 family)
MRHFTHGIPVEQVEKQNDHAEAQDVLKDILSDYHGVAQLIVFQTNDDIEEPHLQNNCILYVLKMKPTRLRSKVC